jgi:N-acyl-D-aspartate/D-glutamate deacylase
MRIEEVHCEANRPFRGRLVGDVAKERGQGALDCLLDIADADELKTTFVPVSVGSDEKSWRARGDVLLDPRVVIGASDAGAHLDLMATFAYATNLLSDAVRARGLLSLEEAVHQLTQVPAELYGLRDRGVVREGAIADLVLLDPSRVGPRPIETRRDLPGGGPRIYAEADGVESVWVAGTPVVERGALTGELPGAVLRSGRDTETVTIPASST